MKRGTPDHPKVSVLMGLLGCEKATAVGLLEMLWHFTARYAPRGDIGRWTDERIAAGLGLSSTDPASIVSALTHSGWLDFHPLYRVVVHDWHDHADDTTKKHLKRQRLSFLSKIRRVSGQVPTDPDTSGKRRPAVAVPEPKPEPEPLPQPGAAATTDERPPLSRAYLTREERLRVIAEGEGYLDEIMRRQPDADRAWSLRQHSTVKGSGAYLVALDRAKGDEHLTRTVHALRDTVDKLKATDSGERDGLLTTAGLARQKRG